MNCYNDEEPDSLQFLNMLIEGYKLNAKIKCTQQKPPSKEKKPMNRGVLDTTIFHFLLL